MTAEETLIRFCEHWDQAMIANNAEEIGDFMSEDWVIIGTDGGITSKEDFLNEIRSGNLSHNRMDSDEMRVKRYGNTAVVTAKGTSAGLYKGQSFSFYEWSTSVFIRENDKWRCVLTMLTPAKEG